MQQDTAIEGLGYSRSFLKKAFSAALYPCMLSILSNCATIIADGIIVGRKIGTDGLTAISLCVPVYLILCVLGSLFVSGAFTAASNEIGRDNSSAAQRYYGYALSLCLLSSAAAAAAGIFLSEGIAGLLCSDTAVYGMVLDYTRVTLIGALPKIMIYIPFWFLRLDGRNKTVTAMLAVMGGLNILLDVVFLIGMNMGIFGVALASVIATALACVLGLFRLHTGKSSFRFRFSFPDRNALRQILIKGSPAAMNNLLQTIRLLCINGILITFGGKEAVAVFAVINGISAFSEAVTMGPSQAASAMLGIFHGEHDNRSVQTTLRLELQSGLLYSALFGAVISAGAGLIGSLYGLNMPIRFPLVCLAVSLFPALCSFTLSGYYNIAGHSALSNALLFFRTVLFPLPCLLALAVLKGPLWLFLPAGEFLAVGAACAITGIIRRNKKNLSPYLLMDTSLENSNNLLHFSVAGNSGEISGACEKVTGFCRKNGMPPKQAARISLALEEVMAVISQKNVRHPVKFDIRMFYYRETIGIRIRYDGISLNPLSDLEGDDGNMGIAMIQKMVRSILYKQIFGLNSLLILI
jgi:Na+-driven multidrug efflux pump